MKSASSDIKPTETTPLDDDDWGGEGDDVLPQEDEDDIDIPPPLQAKEGLDKLAVRRRIEQYWEERRLRELLEDGLDE